MNASTIRQAIETLALQEFGAGFSVLPQMFNIDANDSRNLDGGISARWGSISERTGKPDQLLSVAQEFTLDITTRAFVTSNDSKAVTVVDAIYTSLASFLKKAVVGRLGLSGAGTVLECRLNGVSEPRPLNDNQRDIVKMSVNLTVSYVIT